MPSEGEIPFAANRLSIKFNVFSLLLLCGVSLPLFCEPAAHAATFTNGNFDTTTGTNFPASGGAVGATTGSATSTIAGWTTTVGNGGSANVYVGKTGGTQGWIPNSQSGSYCVQLDGSQSSSDAAFAKDGTANTPARTSISQTFTEPVGTYSLSFYINTEVGTGKGGTTGALVNLSGVATGALTYQEYTATNPSGVSAANAVWAHYTDTFAVTNASTSITLTFADDPNTSFSNYLLSSNASIDNVSITSVPEPSTLLGGAAMMITCLYGVVDRRWKARLTGAVSVGNLP